MTITIGEVQIIQQQILPLAASLLMFLVTIELIRRGKLREEYAMLWITASAVLLVFAIFPQLLSWITQLLGLFYLTTVGLICFSFLALIVIHQAVAISRNADDSRRTAQRLAILERQLEELAGRPVGEDQKGKDD